MQPLLCGTHRQFIDIVQFSHEHHEFRLPMRMGGLGELQQVAHSLSFSQQLCQDPKSVFFSFLSAASLLSFLRTSKGHNPAITHLPVMRALMCVREKVGVTGNCVCFELNGKKPGQVVVIYLTFRSLNFSLKSSRNGPSLSAPTSVFHKGSVKPSQ